MPEMKLTKEHMATIFVVTVLLVLALVGMFSGTRIDRYLSKNDDEAQIIALISAFNNAKTEYNLETYLACLSDHGTFMFGGSIMVSKKELSHLLPPFWADRQKGYILSRPIAREDLNGNFFEGILYDPILTVENDQAQAVVTFVTPIMRWKTKLFLDFRKQNGLWQISRLEWDMG